MEKTEIYKKCTVVVNKMEDMWQIHKKNVLILMLYRNKRTSKVCRVLYLNLMYKIVENLKYMFHWPLTHQTGVNFSIERGSSSLRKRKGCCSNIIPFLPNTPGASPPHHALLP